LPSPLPNLVDPRELKGGGPKTQKGSMHQFSGLCKWHLSAYSNWISKDSLFGIARIDGEGLLRVRTRDLGSCCRLSRRKIMISPSFGGRFPTQAHSVAFGLTALQAARTTLLFCINLQIQHHQGSYEVNYPVSTLIISRFACRRVPVVSTLNRKALAR
jgi:hypothetical protein